MKKIKHIKRKRHLDKKMEIKLNSYEMDLLLKSLWLGYSNADSERLLFKNNENDKNKIFYLHRLLSSKANKFFYNKINNDYYIYMDEKDFKEYINKKKKIKKRN